MGDAPFVPSFGSFQAPPSLGEPSRPRPRECEEERRERKRAKHEREREKERKREREREREDQRERERRHASGSRPARDGDRSRDDDSRSRIERLSERPRSREHGEPRRADRREPSSSKGSGRDREYNEPSLASGPSSNSKQGRQERTAGASSKAAAAGASSSRRDAKAHRGKDAQQARSVPDVRTAPDVCFIDTSGDPVAALFGGPEPSKVPKYRRCGAGSVLGLPRSLRITFASARRDGKELELAPNGQRRVRYTDESQAWQAHAQARRRLVPSCDAPEVPGDFVRVRSAPRDHESSDEGGPSYRALGKAPRRSHSRSRSRSHQGASDSDNDDDSDASLGEDPSASLRSRVAALDLRVRADPADGEAWLQLAEALGNLAWSVGSEADGEALMNSKQASKSGTSARQRRRAARDAQMSVLAQALRALPHDTELAVAHLHLGAMVWPREQCEKEWRALLAQRTNAEWAARLWKGYVAWRGTLSETLATMLQVLAEGLFELRMMSFAAQNATDRQTLELGLVHLWAHAAHLLADAGFQERAFALVQAQVELAFCAPEEFQAHRLDASSHAAALESLEAFWDDEAPRIGEEGAAGWKAHAQGQAASDPTPAAPAPVGVPQPSADAEGAARWLAADRQRASMRRRPARTTDAPIVEAGEEEVDPFALIFFSDLRDLLAAPISMPAAQAALLDAALVFLGLPAGMAIAGMSSEHLSSPARSHRHLVADADVAARFWPASLSSSAPPLALTYEVIGGEVMQPQRQSRLVDPFAAPVKLFPPRIDELFPSLRSETWARWFGLVDARDLLAADVEAASFILDDLPAGVGGVPRTLARFALEEAARGHKAAKALARGELSVDRDNLLLWRAFARLEQNCGKVDAARLVYRSALAQAPPKAAAPSGSEAPALWAAWAELEWEAGRALAAVTLLLAAADAELQGAPDDARLDAVLDTSAALQKAPDLDTVRAGRSFETLLRAGGEIPAALASVASCAALLEYLAGDGFGPACAIFELALAVLGDTDELDLAVERSPALESIYLAQIRAALTRAVHRFPGNTVFVALLASHEMRSKAENHVRRTLERAVLPRNTALRGQAQDADAETAWLLALYCELNLNTHTFNEHAVRALFERALADDAPGTRASPLLWRLFVEFEVRVARSRVPQDEDDHMSDSDEEAYREARRRRRDAQGRLRKALDRAKGVAYRAVRASPYQRELYLVFFDAPLREAMSAAELLDIGRLMGERQLRSHVALEDYLAADDGAEPADAAPPVLDADTAAMLERRRLMPY